MERKKCPCCGFYTIESTDEVIVDICEVCFWQYDEVAHEHPDSTIGANHVTLNDARQNFMSFGASEQIFENSVRKPSDEELLEKNE